MSILILIFSLSTLALITPYVVLPWIAKLSAKPTPLADPNQLHLEWPRVSLLIPAHQEEAHLEQKLRQSLALDYPSELLEIIVCSDGSEDRTAQLALRVADEDDRVRVLIKSQREGKAAALNDMAALATGQVLVFTDASASLEPKTLRELVLALSMPNVGVATCAYAVRAGKSATGAERQYWDKEAHQKSALSNAKMLVGAHGAAYATWRERWTPLPLDTINDDYVVPMRLRAQGLDVVYTERAFATELPTESLAQNMARWSRIAQGNIQMIWRYRSSWAHADWRMIASVVGHKLLKTLGPVWIALIATSALGLSLTHPRYLVALMVALGLGLTTLAISEKLTQKVLFGLAAQWAVARGLWLGCMGQRAQWSLTPTLDLSQPAPIPTGVRALKRAVDISAACIGLTLAAPIMIVVSALIRLSSKGPAFFRQERVQSSGPHGERTFVMLKFRTMRQDAEQASGPVWATEQDPRVTPIGRLLRKTRLDELPQLINVLRGEMSLVGPRPERPFFTAQLKDFIPAYDDRVCAAKPGVTGWAQVNCGYDTSIESVRQKLLYDLVYDASLYRVSTYLRMELKIVAMTVVVALTGRGAR